MLEKEQRRREQVVIREVETKEGVIKRLMFLKSQELPGLRDTFRGREFLSVKILWMSW